MLGEKRIRLSDNDHTELIQQNDLLSTLSPR